MRKGSKVGETKMKIVAISGGFDPLHVGHIKLIKEAKKLGDKLIVILNNDNWLVSKKGGAFMRQEDRKEILESLIDVDEVMITFHESHPKDISVCSELEVLHPDVFANGGDRKFNNIPEVQLCKELDIEMVFNCGGEKLRSSSDLVKNSKRR